MLSASPSNRSPSVGLTAVVPLHMDRNQRMRRGHQQQDMENQPENQAEHDQDQVEDRRKRLPVQEQPERRQQGSKQIDHADLQRLAVHTSVTQDLGGMPRSAMACLTAG